MFRRLLANTLTTGLSVRRSLPVAALEQLRGVIRENEDKHGGQIVLAIEPALALSDVLERKSARDRAAEVFSELRVWDTEKNNGVLLYLLFADHNIEIVADRGISQFVSNAQWEKVCLGMEERLQRGEFKSGLEWGIQTIGALIGQHFPAEAGRINDLSDTPVILSK